MLYSDRTATAGTAPGIEPTAVLEQPPIVHIDDTHRRILYISRRIRPVVHKKSSGFPNQFR